MAEAIYVRGDGIATEHVWRFAHPRGPRSQCILTYFDYPAAQFKQWARWDGAQPPATASDVAAPIAGVLDLYDYLKSRGAEAPGTVSELHVFAHAWEGGPVLKNTYDTVGDPNDRDADDMDPRIKDFAIPRVLGGTNGQRFKRAFAPTALVKLWGCTHLEQYRSMITRDYYGTNNAEKKRRAKQKYVGFIESSTYQYALCKAVGLPVYAAPLGWGTNPYLPKPNARYVGRWPPGKSDLWWRVSDTFRHDRGDQFYKRVLGARIDPTGYVGYTEAIVTASYVDVTLDEVMLADYPADYPAEVPEAAV